MSHYIYIPGLGDRFDPLRRLALLRWKAKGVHTTLIPMRWANKVETYEQKYTRIAEAIHQTASKEKIVLVGESAGGAMALLVFSRHVDRVQRVVTICGYNKGAAAIHQVRRQRNPAFYQLLLKTDPIVEYLPASLRQRITTIYSLADNVVSAEHSAIDGAPSTVLRTRGHFRTIGRVLVSLAV